MTVTFWGVRGSFTTAGAGVLRYGGNTSCVGVQIDKKLLVIDAGSGVRILGDLLDESIRDVFFILTHLHRDHIEGFPFFAPLYQQGRRIHLVDYCRGTQRWSLISMLDGVNYPMRPDSIIAEYALIPDNGIDYLREHGFSVDRLRVNHPGGAYGYRVRSPARTFVHIPDNELFPSDPETGFDELVSFCASADVLSHDAMYVDAELPEKTGWGHSTVSQACRLAIAARVGRLVLFHHDPYRNDEQVDMLQRGAEKALEPHGIECTAAYEGLTIEL